MSRKTEIKQKSLAWAGVVIMVRVFLILFICAIFVITMSKTYQIGYRIFNTAAVATGEGYEINFTIKEDDSTKQVARHLEFAGLIDDSFIFKIQKIFYQYRILPGTYTLSTAMTSQEILEVLNSGPKAQESDETKE